MTERNEIIRLLHCYETPQSGVTDVDRDGINAI